MIKVTNIQKQYEEAVLKGVDYTFETNQVYLISGPMGCGKSTLLKIIIGLEQPTVGSVETDIKPSQFSFNEPWHYLYEGASVQANINLYQKLFKTPDLLKKDLITKYQLTSMLKKKVSSLSSGNKKKVSLVCTLMNANMQALILDEPLTNLDKDTIEILKNDLKELKPNRTIILTSHQYTEIKDAVDVHLHIESGVLLEGEY
ncbi:ATP-binding cassette domain-containing protein [Mollicutes bacterium LVI A0039]|nr:ATP-binding cassette domain-containing protein [Mollicutes bacterium LVI A0039]